jgi:hypothetical protein
MTDSLGLLTYVSSWTSTGAIQEIRRQDVSGHDAESWLYSYLTSPDPNAGLLSTVQQRQSNGQGGWSTVQQVVYRYYDGTTSFGNLGDLETASVEDPAGDVLSTEYYRYYSPGESGGYVHGLQYVFDATSFARLSVAVGNPFTASNSQVAAYAHHYFQYDQYRRVTRHDIQGEGGLAAGGIGTLTYSYSTNPNYASSTPTDYNSWQYQTVETLPDGNQNLIFCNRSGDVILKVFRDNSDPGNPALSGEQWLTYTQFDALGRTVLSADPSAVTSYTIDGNNNLIVTLAPNSGVIHRTDYYSSTTATATNPGGVASYVQDTKVQQGSSGTPVLLGTEDYLLQSSNGSINVVPSDRTVYRNSDGSGAETTHYSYTWYPGTVGVQSLTVALPIISTTENGSGTANSSVVYYDAYGNPTWSKDAAGYINYVAYDPATGAVTKTITDVNTLDTVDFTGLPTGWTTPAGGGLELISTMQVDSLGRVVERTDPDGNVTYVVYDDVDHEVKSYAGWNATTHNTTGPISIIRADTSGDYSESLTYLWNDPNGLPVDSQGRPTGAESLSDPNAVIQSFSRTLVNSAGQIVATRQYTSLANVTYSTAQNLGTDGTNYLETDTIYGVLGTAIMVAEPSGTIDGVVYDSLGRVNASWKGTSIVPAVDYNGDATTNALDFFSWLSQNPGATVGPAGTSMHKVSDNVYDSNGVGDGDLTQTDSFFDATPGDDYTTRYQYDWRDRLSATLGANGVATFAMIDNLGETTESQTYSGSTFSSGQIVAGNLRAQSLSSHDELGRVYRTQDFQVTVNASTGQGTPGDYLESDTWFDPRGRVAKTATASGSFEKFVYDGAGKPDRLQFGAERRRRHGRRAGPGMVRPGRASRRKRDDEAIAR